jgi:hypothetical protein
MGLAFEILMASRLWTGEGWLDPERLPGRPRQMQRASPLRVLSAPAGDSAIGSDVSVRVAVGLGARAYAHHVD